MMISAEIVSTGTELLLGQSLNTNAQYLAEQLAALGIACYYQTTVGDNAERIRSVITHALERADMVITTGGLGPTMDDLTKEVVADLWKLELQMDAEELARIEAFFARRGKKMPENNKKQALLPAGAQKVPNAIGTAPGIIVEKGNKTIILLPGPPFEMQPMVETTVIPYLARKVGTEPTVLFSRVLKVVGPGESVIEDRLRDLLEHQSNPTIALLAKDAEVHVRFTARGHSQEAAKGCIHRLEQEVRQRLHPYVYGADDATLASVVGTLLRQQSKTLAIAESCTGGLIADQMTNIPGSSDYLLLGVTSYANRAKQEVLQVPATTLEQVGAVSAETALAMVRGVQALAGADAAVAVTGIAGPGGGTADKPVGLVYIAVRNGQEEIVKKIQTFGDRRTIKLKTAAAALDLLRGQLMANET